MGIKYTLCKSQDSKTMENVCYKNELSGFHYKCCGIRNGKYLVILSCPSITWSNQMFELLLEYLKLPGYTWEQIFQCSFQPKRRVNLDLRTVSRQALRDEGGSSCQKMYFHSSPHPGRLLPSPPFCQREPKWGSWPNRKNIYFFFFPPFSFVFSQINRLIAHLVQQYIFKSAGINSETESTDKWNSFVSSSLAHE